MKSFRPTTQRLTTNAWIRAMLRGRRFKVALNLGCGTDGDMEGGRYSDQLPAERVIKIDPGDLPGLDYRASAEDLPLADGSVDFLFCNWVIYKTDMPQALRELDRVLAPGARAIFSYNTGDKEALARIRSKIQEHYIMDEAMRMTTEVDGEAKEVEVACGQKRNGFPNFAGPVLVLVAHWDDEILSAGGLLQRYGRGWTVACATFREQHAAYQRIFEDVCGELGAVPITLPILQRTRTMRRDETLEQFKKTAKHTELTSVLVGKHLHERVDIDQFDTVITHGPKGDRGHHRQHVMLHKAAAGMFLYADIFCIGYKSGEYELKLTEDEYARKMEMARRYGPAWGSERIFPVEYFTKLT